MQDKGTPGEGGDPRRLRTGWRVRHRFKLVQYALSILGGVLALGAVALAVRQLPEPGMAFERGFLVPAVLLVLLSAGLPWAVIQILWRRAWRRNVHDWGGRVPR